VFESAEIDSCNVCGGDGSTCSVDVTFSVDMSIEGIVGDIKVRTSTVNGEYSPSDWYVMTPNEDGNTFTHTLSLLSGVTYGYNFNNSDGSGYESGGGLADCAGGNYGNDRTLVVGDVDLNLDVVCWESCSACPSIVEGCTDSTATNYNAEATVDDGTCEYPVLEAANLFISEAAEGSSNNKYIEIFNNTDETVSLGMYAYPTVGNAPSTPGEHEYWNNFADGAEVLPGQVYVVCHGSADPDITAACNEQYTYMSNGDDGLCLVFGSESNFEVLDCVGDFNGDPGSGWEVAGVPDATKDHTLVRKSEVTSGNPLWLDNLDADTVTVLEQGSAGSSADDSEWIVLDKDTWTFVGSHPHTLVYGCTDAAANNTNDSANIDDGTCTYSCSGEYVSQIDILITTDAYEDETSFSLTNVDNGNLLNPENPGTLQPNTTNTYTYCVDNGTNVLFELFDEFGDGIVGGGYQIYVCESDLVYSDFGFVGDGELNQESSTSYEFYAACGDIAGCIDPDATNYSMSATVDNGSCDYDCGVGPNSDLSLSAVLTFNTANYGYEMSWELLDSDSAVVAQASTYTFGSFSTYTYDLCLEPNAQYTMSMYDSYGDGWNGSTYELTLSTCDSVVASGTISGSYPTATQATDVIYANCDNSTDGAVCEPWNVILTGANHTVMLPDNASVMIDDMEVTNVAVGVFYMDDSGMMHVENSNSNIGNFHIINHYRCIIR
jgi:hypothetical protein